MHALVNLVKLAVESFVRERKGVDLPKDLPIQFLIQKSGTFVTIEKQGRLRGCIGTYLPTKENIAKEIIDNAIAAASKDYRFGPVQEEELPYLEYTVYTLGEPEPIKDFSQLDPKKYGVIVKTEPLPYSGGDVLFNGHQIAKTGLLLPDLNGIETPERQIAIACQKAGIDPQKEKFIIYRFEVQKYQ